MPENNVERKELNFQRPDFRQIFNQRLTKPEEDRDYSV